MSIIDNHVREIENVNSEHIDILQLPMSKLYLKILGFLYIINNTNFPITLKIVTGVLNKTHIFNNVVLASKPCIIKTSNNSDLAVIWINIWDS